MTTTASILLQTEKFYNKFINLDLNEEQKSILNEYKLCVDLSHNSYLIKQRSATSKYHKSNKGKIKNNNAQKRYYHKHKAEILERKKLKYILKQQTEKETEKETDKIT
jgi:hypothetical protein